MNFFIDFSLKRTFLAITTQDGYICTQNERSSTDAPTFREFNKNAGSAQKLVIDILIFSKSRRRSRIIHLIIHVNIISVITYFNISLQ